MNIKRILVLVLGVVAGLFTVGEPLDVLEWFLTLGGLIGGTVLFTDLLKKWTKANSTWSWVFSFLVGQGLSFFGWKIVAVAFEVGLFINTAEFTWTAPFVALVGAVVTLVANRVFDLETAQRFLEWIGIRMPAAASRLK